MNWILGRTNPITTINLSGDLMQDGSYNSTVMVDLYGFGDKDRYIKTEYSFNKKNMESLQ